MPRKKNYLNNADLRDEIMLSKEKGELTRKALKMLMLLSERAQSKLSYEDPEDKRDCLSFAQMDLIKYWDRYDSAKSPNAFAYFTQMCKNGYAKGWNKLHPSKYQGTISLSGAQDSDGLYSI